MPFPLSFRLLTALLLGPVCSIPVLASAQAGVVRRAAETITESDIRRRVGIIADDSMGGRDTPSKGLDLTAEYLASEFRRLGLTPGGDSGTFVQRYPLSVTHAGATTMTAPNVVGILVGSDPLLRDQYIIFSAHMDHVGTLGSAKGDTIWNGADDDASGTAAVVELAEAFAQSGARPRRSLIFLGVSGEEKGLWGSEYFASHSPVPMRQVVADINMDMIGRNWTDTIAVIGKSHSTLGATLDSVGAEHPELNMHAVNDQWPNENFFYRSDHFNFARRGVPILFFFNGTHGDYHQASDSPDKIDAAKEARIVRLIFYLGHRIGSVDQRPRWRRTSYRKIVAEPYRRSREEEEFLR